MVSRSTTRCSPSSSTIRTIVSQQLAILRAKNIVTARKLGTAVHYALGDPLVTKLLAVAREIFNNHLVDSQTMLRELQRERRK